jgi:hypothetical protein
MRDAARKIIAPRRTPDHDRDRGCDDIARDAESGFENAAHDDGERDDDDRARSDHWFPPSNVEPPRRRGSCASDDRLRDPPCGLLALARWNLGQHAERDLARSFRLQQHL